MKCRACKYEGEPKKILVYDSRGDEYEVIDSCPNCKSIEAME